MCLRSLRAAASAAALAAVACSAGPGARVEPAVQTSDQHPPALTQPLDTEARAVFKAPLARPPAVQGGGHDSTVGRVLRVCADPNNLPFSNQHGEGFENRLVALLAEELHARVEYTWWAERRGFVRETITAGRCDVVGGVPSQFGRTLVTKPYYRSSYVFVTRLDRKLHLKTFDDPALKMLRVGVQLIGEDGQNTPPAHALAARHIVSNVIGYTVYGDYLQPNPPARIVEAVVRNEVDVAIVWGPLAGYFARKYDVPLHISPVAAVADRTTPVAFDISIGVARRVPALCKELDAALDRRRADVQRLLDEYGIPRVQS
jgi:quinoprotein dehydrogenase-associated probable ABC transporter substrate-binding protein